MDSRVNSLVDYSYFKCILIANVCHFKHFNYNIISNHCRAIQVGHFLSGAWIVAMKLLVLFLSVRYSYRRFLMHNLKFHFCFYNFLFVYSLRSIEKHKTLAKFYLFLFRIWLCTEQHPWYIYSCYKTSRLD